MKKLSKSECLRDGLDGGGDLLFASRNENIIDVQALQILSLGQESLGELPTKIE